MRVTRQPGNVKSQARPATKMGLERLCSYWNKAGLYGPGSHMSSVCLLSVENFSQRISLIKEVRKCRNRGKLSRKPNNNNVVIKHSQRSLIPSQGLQIIFWATSLELFILKLHQVEKFPTWWPDCSHDVSCLNCLELTSRNRNKLTPELKINCV